MLLRRHNRRAHNTACANVTRVDGADYGAVDVADIDSRRTKKRAGALARKTGSAGLSSGAGVGVCAPRIVARAAARAVVQRSFTFF